MNVYVPDYYKEFHCIADKCKHTCCQGWEVSIDEESALRYKQHADIAVHMETGEEGAFFKLSADEVCPFLQEDGLCRMIVTYGESMLCQTCTDHPRFRNYWENRMEMGLGLVCEEAARLILTRPTPMKLELLSGQEEENNPLPEDEQWLFDLRNDLLSQITESGPLARLHEYLIFRHIPDALYDDRLEERIRFVDLTMDTIKEKWNESDQSLEALVELVRVFSYDTEYDEEEKERVLNSLRS